MIASCMLMFMHGLGRAVGNTGQPNHLIVLTNVFPLVVVRRTNVLTVLH